MARILLRELSQKVAFKKRSLPVPAELHDTAETLLQIQRVIAQDECFVDIVLPRMEVIGGDMAAEAAGHVRGGHRDGVRDVEVSGIIQKYAAS